VQAAGLIDLLPVAEWGDGYDVHITGQPPYPKNAAMGAETRNVSEGYFAAMGIRLDRGRLLSPSLDGAAKSGRVDAVENQAGRMVVNEAFRRKFFSDGGDPVSAHIDDDPKPELKSEILGVVSDIRQDLNSPPMPEMDWLIDGIPPKSRLDQLKTMFLMARTDGDPKTLIPALRDAVKNLDSTVPFRAFPMEEVISDQLIFERLESWLFGIFAAFAMLLAVIGLYGLISHEVQLNTREIGIRMALGSTRSLVVQRVLRRVAVLLICGTAVGWALSLIAAKVLSSVVTIRTGQDYGIMAALTLVMLLVGILTSLGPARGAASVEPVRALRAE
jgi:hypothetical protein